MDHVPLPWDPILPLTEVPYLCIEPYDTTIPFLEHPRRQGRPYVTPGVGEAPYATHEKLFPTPTRDLEIFFQTWLFFGLLAELLAGLFNHDTFVSTSEEDGSLIISTKQLQSLTEQRFHLVRTLDKPTQEETYLHAIQCIDLALRTLNVAGSDFNSNVKNSIASVAELVGNAVDIAHLGTFPGSVRCRRPGTNDFYTEEMKVAMVAANWCPNDIARLTDKYATTQLLYFFSKMKKPPGVANHQKCTTKCCLAHSMSLSQHRTRHWEACTDENECKDIFIDHEPVVKILRSGALPLLRITAKKKELNKVTIELTSSGTEMAHYVAISHVWADGLGNAEANSLPHCQLARLGAMLDPFAEDGRRPLVWLDTLCCPVDPGAKNLALLQMRRTYAKAHKTLILDSTLYKYDSQGLSAAELQARILTCGWMRRLWTLQESALSSDPWVQFKDGPLTLKPMFDRLKKLHDENLNYRRLVQDLWLDSKPLTLSQYHSPTGAPELWLLDRALSYRNTTVALDEALCIATLMNLDVSQILPLSSEDERMCKVWDLLAIANKGSLPRKMIFLDGVKLDRRGYLWAPSTLLPPGERYVNPQSRTFRWRGPQGKPTPEGLMAKYPSYRFRSYTGSLPSPIWGVLHKMPQVRFMFKDQSHATWWALMYKSTGTPPTSQSPSLIKQKPFVDLVAKGNLAMVLAEEPSYEPSTFFNESYREGILVTIAEEKENTLYANLGEAAMLAPLSPHESIVYDAAERLMQELHSWEQEDSKGLGIAEHVSEERITKVKAKCMEFTRKLLAEEPGLEDAVVEMCGEGGQGWNMWVYVATWFNHVGQGWRVEDEKMWCVD